MVGASAVPLSKKLLSAGIDLPMQFRFSTDAHEAPPWSLPMSALHPEAAVR